MCQCQEQLDAEHFICWTRSLTFLGLYGRKTVLLSSGGYRKAHDVYWIRCTLSIGTSGRRPGHAQVIGLFSFPLKLSLKTKVYPILVMMP